MSEHCLYADVADGTHCALRATADSPPPTSVQWRVVLAERDALREQYERLRERTEGDPTSIYHEAAALREQVERHQALLNAMSIRTVQPRMDGAHEFSARGVLVPEHWALVHAARVALAEEPRS